MKSIKAKDIEKNWHLIDARSKILGRLSTEVAMHLMGKNKAYYTPNLDTGDFVVVVNASQILMSGKKESQKKYAHHSGFPGGLKVKTAKQIKAQKPDLLVRKSVKGMLPKTTLGKQMAKKLYVYAGDEHPFKDKFKN